jgi:hypothetical protein
MPKVLVHLSHLFIREYQKLAIKIIIAVVRSIRINWVRHVGYMGEIRNAKKNVCWKI